MTPLLDFLRPKQHTLLAAVKTARLGCTSLICALQKTALAWREEGKIPAVVEEAQVIVREQLCPDLGAAIQVQRQTAWCRFNDFQCKHATVFDAEEGWVECAALGGAMKTAANEGKKPSWWISLPSRDKPTPSTLSKLVKVLGPLALLQMSRPSSSPSSSLDLPKDKSYLDIAKDYNITKSVLQIYKVPYTYNSGTRIFTTDLGTIRVLTKGVEITPTGQPPMKVLPPIMGSLFTFVGEKEA